jgi:hypothetical protein
MAGEVAAGDNPQGTTFESTCVPKYVVVDPESVTNRSGVRHAAPGPVTSAAPLGWATFELRGAPDQATKAFALAASQSPPEPVAVQASPGEQGQRGRRSSRSSRSSPDDPDPEPPAVVHLRGFTAASVRMVQHCERRRAAMKWA